MEGEFYEKLCGEDSSGVDVILVIGVGHVDNDYERHRGR